MMHSTLRRLALAALLAGMLAGCGFQLRSPRALPFESIFLGMNEYSDLAAALRRQIHAGSRTRITERADDAQVRLEVLADTREKAILALNTQGRVREYQLRQRFSFRVVGKDGEEVMPASEIQLHRDLAFDDTQVLAKEQEELLLYRDMQNDLIQQLMRRLSMAKMPAAKPASDPKP